MRYLQRVELIDGGYIIPRYSRGRVVRVDNKRHDNNVEVVWAVKCGKKMMRTWVCIKSLKVL